MELDFVFRVIGSVIGAPFKLLRHFIDKSPAKPLDELTPSALAFRILGTVIVVAFFGAPFIWLIYATW